MLRAQTKCTFLFPSNHFTFVSMSQSCLPSSFFLYFTSASPRRTCSCAQENRILQGIVNEPRGRATDNRAILRRGLIRPCSTVTASYRQTPATPERHSSLQRTTDSGAALLASFRAYQSCTVVNHGAPCMAGVSVAAFFIFGLGIIARSRVHSGSFPFPFLFFPSQLFFCNSCLE